ncbi:MAG: NAD(P)H-quinone oxidoreductase subunit 3 [SAR324 cluster bacterium]|uniref:NADH-quinone oxidoreductase subunit A n=1 Tax=SAR324 cluster bacterium TaxID=2024889 RepID=A0A7X9IIH8_9DELT|nr:NAD(P)H-quinone oxidoreductase subunit 3 [SAR324 cluster bacterium]
MSPYFALSVFFVVCSAFVVAMLLMASFIGPKNKTHTKQLPFECGAISSVTAHAQRFHVRFYLVAVLFLLFDVEVIFMYPWALALEDLGLFAFWQMCIFVFMLGAAFIYEWKKGLLQWNDPD